MTPPLVASDRAPGLHVGPEVELPDDVEIAPHVTIYDGSVIGAGVRLAQGAIVGRPQEIGVRSRTPVKEPGRATVIGDGGRIGSGTVVAAGTTVGRDTYLSDLVLLREGATIGDEVMIGRGTAISHDVVVGDRTRIQNDTMIGPATTIGDDVLVAPRVTFVGDPTMGRRDTEVPTGGIRVERACRIGTSALIFPPVVLGEESVVGALAMVRADVAPRTVVVGAPARHLRAVGDEELLDRWR